VDALINAFLLSRQADGCTDKTLAWHRTSLRTFQRWLERNGHSSDPQTWTAPLLREYVIALKTSQGFRRDTPLAPTTVTTRVQSLLAFTRWLHLEGLTDTNVGARVKKPRPPKIEKAPYSPDELRRMLAVTTHDLRDHTIITVLIDCGLRASELCTLLVEDIYLDQLMLKVTGKGRKDRLVPYSVQTANTIRRYLNKERPRYAKATESPYVFMTSKTERFLPNSLLQLIRRVGFDANVDGCNVHRFRHTFAITYLRNGGDPLSLQRIMGHTSLSVTNGYVAMSRDDLVERHAAASPIVNLRRRHQDGTGRTRGEGRN